MSVFREDSYDSYQPKLLLRQNRSTPEENQAEWPLFWLSIVPEQFNQRTSTPFNFLSFPIGVMLLVVGLKLGLEILARDTSTRISGLRITVLNHLKNLIFPIVGNCLWPVMP